MTGTTALRLQAAASRAYVPNVGDGLPVYLQVELELPELPSAHTPVHLALLIDRSGSMYNSERLAQAMTIGEGLIAGLGEEDSCTIIAFAERAHLVAQGRVAEQRETLLTRLAELVEIDPLKIGGGSNLQQGLAAASAELRNLRQPELLSHLVLITDARTGGENCLPLVEAEGRAGVAISTIGIGDDFDENLLTAIAEKSGGNYYYLGSPGNTSDICTSELAWLRSITIKAALLESRLLAGVKLLEAFRYQPVVCTLTARITPTGYNLWLGHLNSGQRVGLLLGLLVPPKQLDSACLANFELKAGGLEPSGVLAEASVEIKFCGQPSLIGRLNSSVMGLVEQVCVINLKRQADAALAVGNVKKALGLLNAARTATERLGQRQLTELFDQLLEQAGTQGRFENASAKRAGLLIRALGNLSQTASPARAGWRPGQDGRDR